MSFHVVAGRYANHLERALSVTMTPSADAAYPVGGLYDRRSSYPAKFGSIAADSTIVADLCALSDPSFEVGVSSWTAASGTLDRSNAQANTGTYSARFVAAGSWYRDFTARAGEVRQISAALYGGGGAVASIVRLYCVETGHYLQAGGASWAAASADLFSRTTASWATSTQAYTVEPLGTTLTDTVTLRVYVVQTGAGTTYRDDVVDIPGTTWASVHGHNLSAAVVPVVDSSPDNSAWTTRLTPTLRRDCFYGSFAVQYVRYWRLKLGGTPGAVPWLGEFVLGQYESLTCAPDYPVSIEYLEPEVRQMTAQGGQYVYGRGGGPARRLGMVFRFRNDTEFQQVRDTFFRGSRAGAWPLVVVPTETDPDVCILGRTQEGLLTSRISYAIRTGELEVVEEPLPLMA